MKNLGGFKEIINVSQALNPGYLFTITIPTVWDGGRPQSLNGRGTDWTTRSTSTHACPENYGEKIESFDTLVTEPLPLEGFRSVRVVYYGHTYYRHGRVSIFR